MGLVLMISLRDPLRDTLMFVDFTQGILGGAIVMGLLSPLDFARYFRRYTYTFIAATAILGLALATLGSGPGGSDAKVNLFFFQPVEVMRLLIVFFLAGYFAQNWDVLRDLRQKSGPLAAHFHIPRLDYVLPVAAGVAVAVLVFVGIKDNGPALVIGALFLIISTRWHANNSWALPSGSLPHRVRLLGRTSRAFPRHRCPTRRHVALAMEKRGSPAAINWLMRPGLFRPVASKVPVPAVVLRRCFRRVTPISSSRLPGKNWALWAWWSSSASTESSSGAAFVRR